ncbi:sensor domain-containing diguanylate cyclase [Devosia sp.]|uniref:sensor domain-containing diguanylate cyclase n=1 Tax=Devosia sp. TaxID=1871048 RepID=UPI003263663A
MDDFGFDDTGALDAAKLTQRSLIDTQNQLGSMLDVMPIGLLIHTEQGVLFANREACRLLEVDKGQVVGHHILDYIRSTDIDGVSAQLSGSFSGGGTTFENESVLQRPDGSHRLIKLISGRLPWDGNPVIQILMQDITEQKRAETSLRQLTITDELTGAYNRRHALYEAALYTSADTKSTVPLSVVMLDIDHFKRVNDTYGHGVGDTALKRLARLAFDYMPTIDGTDSALFARIGGEEFLMLLPGLTAAQAEVVAERFRRAVQKLEIKLPDCTLKFTISLGVAQFCESDGNFDKLLSRADQALYEAKASGRNAVRNAG